MCSSLFSALRQPGLGWLLAATALFPLTEAAATHSPFVHPGLLHTQADLQRMQDRVIAKAEPWQSGWLRLMNNPHASLNWNPAPQREVIRGQLGQREETYRFLYDDMAAAYALALRWHISGNTDYADRAVLILKGWASTLTRIDGSSDRYLAAGLYGYQMANAAELLRDYPGWSQSDQSQLKGLLLGVFYPLNHDFLTHHLGAKPDHYWANWDLVNMASVMAIGVFTDRPDLYAEALHDFKFGEGNGSIQHLIWKLYPDGLGQVQESGRDQGHANLDIAMLGILCQMAWNQGDDLFGYDDNRVLKGAEYVARYNLGQSVPYTPYQNTEVNQPVISAEGRGDLRPIWELLYQHYVVLKHLKAPGITAYAQKSRPEGGGGDYGPNSGGYDQLGYGTLTYTLK